MQTAKDEAAKTPELLPLNAIRVETALSRYPVHRLAKQGTVGIDIREQNELGDVVIRWKVSHNSEYGQPGPLAYKLDTLIVNRRIEEASRPIPRIIKLGSLHDICHELGISEGKNRDNIKRALYQNASAFLTAKLRYSLAGRKGMKDLEAGFTRYSVVFTGEELPDGRKADAVYLVLNEIFMQVINGAETRPLDYDYLRDLPPASQRLYELLSFQMYGALNNNRPRAKLFYSEYCRYAPQSRYFEREQVRKQMYKIHVPHLKSRYIESVELEQTTDQDGNPDWLMLYTPGPKARAEFRAFNKKGGPRILEIEQAPPALPTPKLVEPEPEPTPLELELISRGVTASTARELVAEYPEERIIAQVEHFDWLKAKHPKKVKESSGGYLADSIRKNYATPEGFVSKAERTRREEAKGEEQRRETDAARKRRAAMAAEQEHRAQVEAYLTGLETAALEQLDREALEHADPEARTSYEQATLPILKQAHLRIIRESHVRRILGLPEPVEG